MVDWPESETSLWMCQSCNDKIVSSWKTWEPYFLQNHEKLNRWKSFPATFHVAVADDRAEMFCKRNLLTEKYLLNVTTLDFLMTHPQPLAKHDIGTLGGGDTSHAQETLIRKIFTCEPPQHQPMHTLSLGWSSQICSRDCFTQMAAL